MSRKTSLLFAIAVVVTAAVAVWTARGDLTRLNLWVCIAGPLLGVMIGIYGGIAGGLVRTGRARQPVMTVGLLFLAACLGMAMGGVILFLMGRPWMFAIPWLIVGGLCGLIFAPLLRDLGRRYDRAESRRLAAPDPSAVDGLRTKASRLPGLLLTLAICVFIWSVAIWEREAGPDITRWAWLPGALTGVLIGTYGSAAGGLALKGRGRGTVLAVGVLLLAASLAMLAGSLALFFAGRPYEYCWPWFVPGAVGSAALIWLLSRLLRYYHQAQLLRLAAPRLDVVSDLLLPVAMAVGIVVVFGVLLVGRLLWGEEIPNDVAARLGVLGALLGPAAGIYVAIALPLAHRGRAQKAVMALGVLFFGACAVMLLAGIALYLTGRSPDLCYPWTFMGAIGSFVFGLLLVVVGRRYRESELRRLQARDISSA